jgi:molecular chaperone DnaK
VQQLLQNQLHHELHREIDPDLCVSLGAAVQGALVAGMDVGQVLVDITPHTLGIQCLGELFGLQSDDVFSPIIRRNTPLPATRSEIYGTCHDGQDQAEIHVLQGEHDVATLNESVGRFMLEGLNEEASQGSEILVRFELDLNGMLRVTACERDTGLSKEVVIDNAVTRFRAESTTAAKARLAEIFADTDDEDDEDSIDVEFSHVDQNEPRVDNRQFSQAQETLAKARRLLAQAPPDDADEMRSLIHQLSEAITASQSEQVRQISERLDDLIFYLQDT